MEFSSKELYDIVVDFLQPKFDEEYEAIFRFIGVYAYDKALFPTGRFLEIYPQSGSLTMEDVTVGDNHVEFKYGDVKFSKLQLQLFSALGVDIISRGRENLFLYRFVPEYMLFFQTEQEITREGSDETFRLSISKNTVVGAAHWIHPSMSIDDIFVVLKEVCSKDSLMRIQKDFENILYRDEENAIRESYNILHKTFPESSDNLALQRLHDIYEENDILRRRKYR